MPDPYLDSEQPFDPAYETQSGGPETPSLNDEVADSYSPAAVSEAVRRRQYLSQNPAPVPTISRSMMADPQAEAKAQRYYQGVADDLQRQQDKAQRSEIAGTDRFLRSQGVQYDVTPTGESVPRLDQNGNPVYRPAVVDHAAWDDQQQRWVKKMRVEDGSIQSMDLLADGTLGRDYHRDDQNGSLYVNTKGGQRQVIGVDDDYLKQRDTNRLLKLHQDGINSDQSRLSDLRQQLQGMKSSDEMKGDPETLQMLNTSVAQDQKDASAPDTVFDKFKVMVGGQTSAQKAQAKLAIDKQMRDDEAKRVANDQQYQQLKQEHDTLAADLAQRRQVHANAVTAYDAQRFGMAQPHGDAVDADRALWRLSYGAGGTASSKPVQYPDAAMEQQDDGSTVVKGDWLLDRASAIASINKKSVQDSVNIAAQEARSQGYQVPAAFLPQPKQYRVNPATGQMVVNPANSAQALAQADQDRQLTTPQAVEVAKQIAAHHETPGIIKDFGDRILLNAGSSLLHAISGISRFVGAHDTAASLSSTAKDFDHELQTGEKGMIDPNRAGTVSGIAGNIGGQLLAFVPAMVGAEAAGAGAAALGAGRALSFLAGNIPAILQMGGNHADQAYAEAKQAGATDEEALGKSGAAFFKAVPEAATFAVGGWGAGQALKYGTKILPVLETPFGRGVGSFVLGTGGNLVAQGGLKAAEGQNPFDQNAEEVAGAAAFAVHGAIGAGKSAGIEVQSLRKQGMNIGTAQAILDRNNPHPEIVMLQATARNAVSPSERETAAKQIQQIQQNARDWMTQFGKDPAVQHAAAAQALEDNISASDSIDKRDTDLVHQSKANTALNRVVAPWQTVRDDVFRIFSEKPDMVQESRKFATPDAGRADDPRAAQIVALGKAAIEDGTITPDQVAQVQKLLTVVPEDHQDHVLYHAVGSSLLGNTLPRVVRGQTEAIDPRHLAFLGEQGVVSLDANRQPLLNTPFIALMPKEARADLAKNPNARVNVQKGSAFSNLSDLTTAGHLGLLEPKSAEESAAVFSERAPVTSRQSLEPRNLTPEEEAAIGSEQQAQQLAAQLRGQQVAGDVRAATDREIGSAPAYAEEVPPLRGDRPAQRSAAAIEAAYAENQSPQAAQDLRAQLAAQERSGRLVRGVNEATDTAVSETAPQGEGNVFANVPRQERPAPQPEPRTLEQSISSKDRYRYAGKEGFIIGTTEAGEPVFRATGTNEEIVLPKGERNGEPAGIEGLELVKTGQQRKPAQRTPEVTKAVEQPSETLTAATEGLPLNAEVAGHMDNPELVAAYDALGTGKANKPDYRKPIRSLTPEAVARNRKSVNKALESIDRMTAEELGAKTDAEAADVKMALAEPFLQLDEDLQNYEKAQTQPAAASRDRALAAPETQRNGAPNGETASPAAEPRPGQPIPGAVAPVENTEPSFQPKPTGKRAKLQKLTTEKTPTIPVSETPTETPTNAVPEPSPTPILPRQPETVAEAGGGREGVGQGQQGTEAPGAGAPAAEAAPVQPRVAEGDQRKSKSARKKTTTPFNQPDGGFISIDDEGNYITQETKNGRPIYKVWKHGDTVASLVGTYDLREKGLARAQEHLDRLSTSQASNATAPATPPQPTETAAAPAAEAPEQRMKRLGKMIGEGPAEALEQARSEWPSNKDYRFAGLGRLAETATLALRSKIPGAQAEQIVRAYIEGKSNILSKILDRQSISKAELTKSGLFPSFLFNVGYDYAENGKGFEHTAFKSKLAGNEELQQTPQQSFQPVQSQAPKAETPNPQSMVEASNAVASAQNIKEAKGSVVEAARAAAEAAANRKSGKMVDKYVTFTVAGTEYKVLNNQESLNTFADRLEKAPAKPGTYNAPSTRSGAQGSRIEQFRNDVNFGRHEWEVQYRNGALSEGDAKAWEKAKAENPERAKAIEQKVTSLYGEPTPDGGATFSKGSRGGYSTQASDVQKLADHLGKKLVNKPEVSVIQSYGDLPEAVRDQYREMGVKAFYKGGKVTMIAEAMSGPRDAAETFAHEVTGHHGLRGVLGDGFHEAMDRAGLEARSEVVELAQKLGLDIRDTAQRREAIEEHIARQAEKGDRFLPKTVNWIKEQLQKLFPGVRFQDDFVRGLLRDSKSYLRGELGGTEAGNGETRFSRAYSKKELWGFEDAPKQGQSSKFTSLEQAPATLKRVEWKSGTINADIGGGRSTQFTDGLRERGVENIVVDPFWKSQAENQEAARKIAGGKADTVTVNNVLNVIDNAESRGKVIAQAADALKPDGTAYFLIHQGEGTGIGRITKRQGGDSSWQNHLKAEGYIPEIAKQFNDVQRSGNLISARLPKVSSEETRFSRAEGAPQLAAEAESDKAYADLESRYRAGDAAAKNQAQRLVQEAAYNAGYKWGVKHGTGAKEPFYVFDPQKGVGSNSRFEMNNWGIWTTHDDASPYGDKVMNLIGKMDKPKRFQTFNEWFDDYVKNAYSLFHSEGITANELSKDLQDFAKRYYQKGDKRGKNPNTGDKEYRNMLADLPGAKGYVESLKKQGYDGVLIEGDKIDGQLQTVRVFLDPNQVKSAEPFTYDDNGKLIPPSQRFNSSNDDIRYSLVSDAWDSAKASLSPALHEARARGTKDAITSRFDFTQTGANVQGHRAGSSVRLDFSRDKAPNESKAQRKEREQLESLDRQAASLIVEATTRGQLEKQTQDIELNASTEQKAKYLPIYEHALRNYDALSKKLANYKKLNADQFAREIKAGLKMGEIQDYITHIIERPTVAGEVEPIFNMGAGGGAGSKYFTKTRDFQTLTDAIVAGAKPQLDIADLTQRRVNAGERAVLQKGLMQEFAATKAGDGKPIITEAEIKKSYYTDPVSGKRTLKTDQSAPDGYTIVHIGGQPVAIHNQFANTFKQLYGESAIRQSGLGRGLLKAAAAAKHLTLVLDTFHAGRMLYKMASGGGGMPVNAEGWNIRKGLSLLEYRPEDLDRAVKAGEISKEQADYAKENNPKLEIMLKHGLNVGKVADNLLEQAKLKIPGVSTFNEWLFQKLSRSAMTQTAVNAYDRNLKMKGATPESAARQTAKEMNEMFGNLQNQGLFKSKTMQDLSRLVFLAPQWAESQLRGEARAYGQLAAAPVRLAQGQGMGSIGNAGKAWLMGGLAMLAANQVVNYLSTGHSTFENEEGHQFDAYIPNLSGGRGFWFNPLEMNGEYAHAVHKYTSRGENLVDASMQVLENKLSPLGRAVTEGVSGRDFAGRRFETDADRARAVVTDALPSPLPLNVAVEKDPRQPLGYRTTRTPGAVQKQFQQMVGLKTSQEQSNRSKVYAWAGDFRPDKAKTDVAGQYTQLRRALDDGDRKAAADEIQMLLDKGRTFKDIRSAAGINDRGEVKPELFTGSKDAELEMLRSFTPERRRTYAKAQMDHKKNAALLKQVLGTQRFNVGEESRKRAAEQRRRQAL